MKKTICAFFLFLCLLCVINAQDFAAGELQPPLLFSSGAGSFAVGTDQLFALNQTAYSPQYPSSFGGKFGFGLLNIFFGLGSYIAGDWGWGIGLTVWQGLGVAGVLGFGWDDVMGKTFFNGFGNRWTYTGWGLLSGLGLGLCLNVLIIYGGNIGGYGELIIIPVICAVLGGISGFCVDPEGYSYQSGENMKWAVFSLGFWATGAIFGIILPHLPFHNKPQTARLDDPRNWTISFVPVSDGRFAGQIAFNAHLK